MAGLARARTIIQCAAFAIAITGAQVYLPHLAAGQIILFEDSTAEAGINLQSVTHTVSWGDFNNDGCPDLWISKHAGDDGQAATLYKNLCNGRFADVTADVVGDLSGGLDFHGAAWADFDNDGDADLIQLTGAGERVGTDATKWRVRLYENSGGILTDKAAAFGIEYPLVAGRMPLWLDYDNDGKLDVFIGADHRPDGQSPPTIFHQGDNVFEDARSVTGFNLETSRYALVSNLNEDRRMELVATSGVEGAPEQALNVYETSALPFVDLTPQFLSKVRVKGRFSEFTIADFNNDLRPDIYITRRGPDGPNQIWINTGSNFVDASRAAGISGLQIAGNAVVEGDFDNDGDVDIYIDQATQDTNLPNVLLDNQGDGTFIAVYDAGGPTDTPQGRGGSMAVADYDGDGFLDVAVTNGEICRSADIIPCLVGSEGNLQLLHNRGNGNHWLKVQLTGKESNRDAIGASVTITANGSSQLREVGKCHRFAQDDKTVHFGVAGATMVDSVTVRWPSGKDTVLNNVAANQVIKVSEQWGRVMRSYSCTRDRSGCAR